MTYHRFAVLAILAVAPAVAQAQFTTFIPPQNKVADSAKAVVATQVKAHSDSAVNMQLANMKTWVDSAAGIAQPAPGAAEASINATPTANTSVMAMRNGRRAPATASLLPLFALIGAIALATGVFLLSGPLPSRPRA